MPPIWRSLPSICWFVLKMKTVDCSNFSSNSFFSWAITHHHIPGQPFGILATSTRDPTKSHCCCLGPCCAKRRRIFRVRNLGQPGGGLIPSLRDLITIILGPRLMLPRCPVSGQITLFIVWKMAESSLPCSEECRQTSSPREVSVVTVDLRFCKETKNRTLCWNFVLPRSSHGKKFSSKFLWLIFLCALPSRRPEKFQIRTCSMRDAQLRFETSAIPAWQQPSMGTSNPRINTRQIQSWTVEDGSEYWNARFSAEVRRETDASLVHNSQGNDDITAVAHMRTETCCRERKDRKNQHSHSLWFVLITKSVINSDRVGVSFLSGDSVSVNAS